MIITSPGGLHFPIRKSALKFNPNDIIESVKRLGEIRVIRNNTISNDRLEKFNILECIRNTNDMIALPGTVAYTKTGKRADPKVLNWDDFDFDSTISK